jgi:Flp pilus assembly protein CpaB
MKSKTLILLTVAVVCGLAASYMTSRLLADRSEKISILIAKQKFGPWTPIKNPEDQFEFEERLKNEVPKNAVVKFESVKDHVIIKGMEKGDPVTMENLLSKEKGGLEVLLPQGKRAVAVRTTAEKVAGGFVLPGSRVDVIHTLRRNDKEAESHVVLQNILVRAVDQQSLKPEDKPGMVPATVTLEVTPQQALILTRVQDQGTITLALRSYGDDQLESFEPAAPPLPPPPPVVIVKKEEPKNNDVKAPTPPPAPPEPVVERKYLSIQNGNHWMRATFETKDGQMRTYVDQSEQAALPPLQSSAASTTKR